MKKIINSGLILSLVLLSTSCSLFGGDQSEEEKQKEKEEQVWSQEQLSGYLNRDTDFEMSYAGPFYFGEFEGINENSKNYSEMRENKADEILDVLDEGINTLVNLDKKLKEQKEIFSWYVSEIQKIDGSTKTYTNKVLRATNLNTLSEALSNLLVLKNKVMEIEKSPEWGYFQYQKLGALVELTNLYTVEVGSEISRFVALYYLLETDNNTAYRELNKQYSAKIEPLSDEVYDLLNRLYYLNSVVSYGEKLLLTADYHYSRDTVKTLDAEIAKADDAIKSYTGANPILSEKMLALLKTKLHDMQDYRNSIVAYLDSIPAEELLVSGKAAPSAFSFKTAYAQMDIPGFFQQKVKDAINVVKTAKNVSIGMVKIAGEKLKDLYDKSGAHEVVKDGAQILNGGIELVNSGVEVSIHGLQGIYYGDMSWADFKKKVEAEKNELNEKFIKGTLGKEQLDEMIRIIDDFKGRTDKFVNTMSEFSGDFTTIVTGKPGAGKFVQNVTKNVGNEAKKVLDSATEFSKNIAIIMHPETSKEDTRKALLGVYKALQGIKDDKGKLKNVKIPDIKELIKEETIKELGLSEEEEKEFLDQLKDIFKDELKKGETKDETKKKTEKDTKKTTIPPSSDAVTQILSNPNLTDEQIRDLLIKEITKGLPPIKGNKETKEKDENKDEDKDGVLDSADNCVYDANPDQADLDDDGIGNVCDPDCSGDRDSDGICNEQDNCPEMANSDQADIDKDDKGNVCDDDAPAIGEIAGSWPGNITITDVYISDELRKQAAETEGCDISQLESAKGQVKPVSIIITPTSENGGTLSVTGKDINQKAIPFTYIDGVLDASFSDQGGNMNINMNFSGDQSTGKLNLDYLEGNAVINGMMEFKK